MFGPTVRDLTAQHVTRLAREAVYGNARFTTTTIAPGAFRVRAVSGVGGGDLDAVSQSNVLTEVRNYLIRFGYDASVSRPKLSGPYVLTVIDAPRREREAAEYEEKRQETLERELSAIEARHGARQEVVAEPTGELRHEVSCSRFGGVWTDPCTCTPRYVTAEELSAEEAAAEATCGECGEPLRHAEDGSWGHFNAALDGHPEPRAEAPGGVGYVEPEASFDGVPYTTEESRAHLEAGFSLVGRHGGYRSCTVRDRRQGDRELGTVSAVTESLGRGVWVRFAAYRHDGCRVGYAGTRLEAAELLRAEYPAPGPVSLTELSLTEYVVRRDGEELGRVRTDERQPRIPSVEGVRSEWYAIDSDGITRVQAAASPALAASALVEGIDRRARSAEVHEAWLERESAANAPDEVLPSGRYGVKHDTARTYVGPEPVLRVVQRFDNGRWGATPGRWTATTLAARSDLGSLSIDAGAGWGLDAADTARLVELAREALSGV